MKKIALSLFALFCTLIISCGQQQPQAEEEQQYEVTINTTEGPITVALYNDTPLHRDNFVQQAEAGYFDSTLFHRVIRDFMIALDRLPELETLGGIHDHLRPVRDRKLHRVKIIELAPISEFHTDYR